MSKATFEAAGEYARCLLRQHELDPLGQVESAELNAICEAMDSPWERMDGWHRRLMKGLSIDLYSLADGRRGALMSMDDQKSWQEKGLAALQTGDPAIVLEHLRTTYPYALPAGAIPFLQGQQWMKIGLRDVAIVFIEAASKRLAEARFVLMELLSQAGRVDNAFEVATRIFKDDRAGRHDTYLAAATTYLLAFQKDDPEAHRHMIETIISPLERALKEERRAAWQSVDLEQSIVAHPTNACLVSWSARIFSLKNS